MDTVSPSIPYIPMQGTNSMFETKHSTRLTRQGKSAGGEEERMKGNVGSLEIHRHKQSRLENQVREPQASGLPISAI